VVYFFFRLSLSIGSMRRLFEICATAATPLSLSLSLSLSSLSPP